MLYDEGQGGVTYPPAFPNRTCGFPAYGSPSVQPFRAGASGLYRRLLASTGWMLVPDPFSWVSSVPSFASPSGKMNVNESWPTPSFIGPLLHGVSYAFPDCGPSLFPAFTGRQRYYDRSDSLPTLYGLNLRLVPQSLSVCSGPHSSRQGLPRLRTFPFPPSQRQPRYGLPVQGFAFS